MKKIIFDMNALTTVAKYLEEHNSNGREREEIAGMIMTDMKRYAFDPNYWFTGTAGYYVLFDQIDDDTVSVDIMVSTSFGDDHCFIEMVL